MLYFLRFVFAFPLGYICLYYSPALGTLVSARLVAEPWLNHPKVFHPRQASIDSTRSAFGQLERIDTLLLMFPPNS